MRFILLSSLFLLFNCNGLFSQTSLFDDTRVSDVYIEISPDSLEVIMTDVLSDHYFKARFIFDYGNGRDTVQEVGFRLRGNTSRYSRKKSFKVSFNEFVSGQKYQGVKKINLNGQHNDPSLIREKLFYNTWNKAGMSSRNTSFVRLFINQEYYGLYTNLEEFDKDWLQRVYGEKSGNLYKCTYPADLVYHGTNQQTYKDIQSGATTGGRAYDLQTNEIQDDYTDLVGLITTLNKPADSVFAVQIAMKLNIDSFLKAFAIDVATGNWDGYMYNKNNYFLYHRADIDKFEYISYDTDNTFGVDWVNQDWTTRNCLLWYNQTESRPMAKKILAVPAFKAKYIKYLDTVTRTLINPNVIFSHIDSLKFLIQDAAIADFYRTLDYGYTVADFNNSFVQTIDNHTPYGIKPFLTKRYTTILQQIGTISVPDNPGNSSAIIIYPNPAADFIIVKTESSGIDRHGFILDVTGRKFSSFVMGKNESELSLSLSNLPAGVYFLVLEKNGYPVSRKFVKYNK